MCHIELPFCAMHSTHRTSDGADGDIVLRHLPLKLERLQLLRIYVAQAVPVLVKGTASRPVEGRGDSTARDIAGCALRSE
jgi:hypothetical protein